MIKSVNNYPITQLLDIEGNVVYAIPRYQREYTWSKSQWENLFDDVFENDPGYFLGSIICINHSPDTLSTQSLELVDGQQRLTTLSLLLAALYTKLKAHNATLNDEQRVELVNLKRMLVLKKGDDVIRLVPQIQNYNQDDYRAILAKIKIIGAYDKPPYAGNRKIFRAYRYFLGRLEGVIKDLDKPVNAITEFLDNVRQSCLVKIEVASHADAYTLFESLNNRGMPLTGVDLIKNKLLAQLEKADPGKVDHYFKLWNRLLTYLGDDYAVQERFFRQYYNAFREDLKAIFQVPLATRSNLIQVYERLINHDAQLFLQEVSEAGRLYATILARRSDHTLKDLAYPLKQLERIQGAPSYLLMLHLLVRQKALDLNIDHLTSIISLLVRFFVRRNLTDTPPTRDMTRVFMTIVEGLDGTSGAAVPELVRTRLLEISASDESFRQKLEGPIYEENAGVTRFILCALAEQGMTEETWVDLWRTKGKQFLWTIEHVLPQGENIPKPWVNMIADGDVETAREIQRSHVHRLGNLTISGFNSSLGNKSFEDKRDRCDKKKRPVGYKNGLSLNARLAKARTWDTTGIEKRTDDLVSQAMELFSLMEPIE